MTNRDLVKLAIKAQKNSYSPYSHFEVGAALLTKSGKVYLGTNIENCAFGLCNCAERTALFSAIAQGDKKFAKMAIIGDDNDYCYPCGSCRQVLSELMTPKTKVICAKTEKDFKIFTVAELLPNSFTPQNIEDSLKEE